MSTSYGQGRYRVIGPLGSGGFAEVYEVEDTRLGVRRALKLLRAELAADPVARARFSAEAQLMARLSHPHLVAVTDVGEDADATGVRRMWLVMELLSGGTLADRIARRGALRAEEAVRAMLGVIDGVALAHRSGVIHRDIKPANLLFDADGRLKLGDFGIAQLRSLDDLTRTGVALGSWAFMAPEQRLDPRGVGPASDVYGLAATLVWMIHGAPVSDLHVSEHRARLLVGVPDGIAGALSRALAFRPEERFHRVEGLGEVLGLGVGEPPPASAMGAATMEIGRPAGRNTAPSVDSSFARLRRAAAWSSVITLGGLALIGAYRWRKVDPRADAAPPSTEILACGDRRTGSILALHTPAMASDPPGLVEAMDSAVGDFDGDGELDVAWSHHGAGGVRVAWAVATGLVDLTDAPTPRLSSIGAGDLDGDGRDEIVGATFEASEISFVRFDRATRTGSLTSIEQGQAPTDVGVTDVDGDGRGDVTFRVQASGALRWRRNLDGLRFSPDVAIADAAKLYSMSATPAATRVAILTEGVTVETGTLSRQGELSIIGPPISAPLKRIDGMQLLGDELYLWKSDVSPGQATVIRIGVQNGVACRLPTAPPAFHSLWIDRDTQSAGFAYHASCPYCTSSYWVYRTSL